MDGRGIVTMPRVATIATLASRAETFQMVLPVIHAQVDHVFVYLDGYGASPSFLERFDRVTVRRAEDLHASSRFLCLEDLSAPTVVLSVDDDIIYPPDYVSHLGACPSNRCSNPSESDSSLDYEQALSPLEYRSDAASAAECAGLCAQGPRLAVYR